jgi:hypothetical protein
MIRFGVFLLLCASAFAQGGLTYQQSQTGMGGQPVSSTMSPVDGQPMCWNAAHNKYEPGICTSSGIPSGMIALLVSGSCPSGFSEVSALNGKMLRGTLAANGDVGTTGGNATITPSGAVSQPTLTMNAYTPAGSVAAPTFTGSSATSSAVSAGTPAGTNGTATTGATSGGTPAGTISAIAATATAAVAVTTGAGNNMATNAHTHPAPTFTGSALATHTHTVPAEVFTGAALATHTHTLTATGTNSAPGFTGTQATLTGTVSQPSFTGNAVDPSPAFTRVIFCSKN